MTNAELFREVFDLYATEVWAMPNESFLKWLESEAKPEPYAQERKKGKWIRETFEDWWCNQCGNGICTETPENYYYCSNCGAEMENTRPVTDMRGEQDE